MGSFVEINDTLQLTREQGFPKELVLEKHLKNPYKLEDFKDKVFAFKDKPKVRLYQMPPVRNFFVENRDGKWIYWGRVHILEVTHDYVKNTTSGSYKIIYINTPEEMRASQKLVDNNKDSAYWF